VNRQKPQIEHDPTLIDEIDEAFVGKCLYVTREQQTVIVLASFVSHAIKCSSAVPRIIVTGESESGKSTVMDIGVMLSDGGWMSNGTPAAIRAFFNGSGTHTLFMPEASKTFGENGQRGKTTDIYKILADGYRRIATLSYSNNRELVDVSCYGVAWCDGIGDCVPGDIMKRGIRIEMVAKPEDYETWDTLDESVYAAGLAYQEQIHDWVQGVTEYLTWFNRHATRRIHRKMNSRRRQIWGPLFAVAHAAGGRWPGLVMDAFLKIGIDKGTKKPTTHQQLILDTANVIAIHGNPDILFTQDLVDALPDRPVYAEWGDKFLLQQLTMAMGPSSNFRGATFAGIQGQAKGRKTAGIIIKAKEIEALLSPDEEEEDEPDEVEDELSFTPDP
jgi:Protein of unknown function (DUF3631)